MKTKERVVYVLGAGFSAPLGLPVMRNFIEKSKDLYADDRSRYGGFTEIFNEINRMAVTKNFFSADLSNIEEILSILDIGSFARGEHLAEKFARYICDVVNAFTPSLPERYSDGSVGSLSEFVGDALLNYALFVSHVCNVAVSFELQGKTWTARAKRIETAPAFYDIVTLNYDTVLERLAAGIGLSDTAYGFNAGAPDSDQKGPVLAKLHGSADDCKIVPPTWSKGSNREVSSHWARAMTVLSRANYIRFIGYSLPTGDAYIRYLLKAAMLEAPHLKRIDVIGLDPSGEVEQRFREFITFPNYRFRNQNTSVYLGLLRSYALEAAHDYFFVTKFGVPDN
jgi:SIR2-like protein